MTIPYRERGYSVERDSLIVHERRAPHAPPNAHATSVVGMFTITHGAGVPCEVCFKPEPKGKKRRPYIGDTIVEPVAEPEDKAPYWEATTGEAQPTASVDVSADEGTHE